MAHTFAVSLCARAEDRHTEVQAQAGGKQATQPFPQSPQLPAPIGWRCCGPTLTVPVSCNPWGSHGQNEQPVSQAARAGAGSAGSPAQSEPNPGWSQRGLGGLSPKRTAPWPPSMSL